MQKWASRLWRFISDGSTLYGFLPTNFVSVYVLPALGSVVVIAAGITEGIPVMWIITAAFVVLAASFTILVRFTDWRFTRRIEDKLFFDGPRISARRKSPQGGDIVAIKLGFGLVSHASFPIEFEIVTLKTVAGGNINPKPKLDSKSAIIPPKGTGFFDDAEIGISHPYKDCAVECFVEASIKYGRPGKLRYNLSHRYKATIGFNENGDQIPVADWVNDV